MGTDNEAVLNDGGLQKEQQVQQLSQEEHLQSLDDARVAIRPDDSSAGDSPGEYTLQVRPIKNCLLQIYRASTGLRWGHR
jgi:hypothetical protein